MSRCIGRIEYREEEEASRARSVVAKSYGELHVAVEFFVDSGEPRADSSRGVVDDDQSK